VGWVAPAASAPPTKLHLTIQRGPQAVVVGMTAEVLVAVARDGTDAFDGDVTLQVDAVAGLTVPSVIIPRLATTVPLQVAVAEDRRHGDVNLVVRASSGSSPLKGEVGLPIQVRGRPGDLDTSFGDGGIFVLGEPNAEATGAVVIPDGKVLLGGRIGPDPVVVRLNVDGSLDGTWGREGIARASIPALKSTHDVLTWGETTVGGTAGDPPRAFLARFDLSGAPVPTFGSAGVLVVGSQGESRALALGDDGRLVLGGQSTTAIGLQVVRFLPTGASDVTWASSGTALVPLPSPCADRSSACFATALGPKYPSRMTACSSRDEGALLRELAVDGGSDPSYELATPPDVLRRCVSIVNNTPLDFWAAGEKNDGDLAVVHFTVSPTGGPLKVDPYFVPSIPAEAELGPATRVTISAPGYIAVTADSGTARGPSRIGLLRLKAYGALDPEFGRGKSFVTTAIGDAPVHPRALAVGGDGRIIVAGTNGAMVAARYWQ
jgi:uncharacterized delta-60 repeat protein